ncbi:hypothetical protein MKW94_003999 [Papaver nudicaule]|uniref:Uncharacterized protein n=1 Tax=Papaver nudicaule TaxID=74823 RepID=A0AA42AVY3_PAPNU|nr:hypothetical protein [Papaver nudicaule]
MLTDKHHLFVCQVVLYLNLWGGSCQCEWSNIKISQSPTPFQIHGKPEYESDVMINCPEFDNTESVDPSIYEQTGGDLCRLKNGEAVFQNDTIKFKYAWDTPFAQTPSSSRISCS